MIVASLDRFKSASRQSIPKVLTLKVGEANYLDTERMYANRNIQSIRDEKKKR